MNIFFTNKDPIICAAEHCTKHRNKMIIEYAQLLSTAHRMIDGTLYTTKSKSGRSQKAWKLDSDYEQAIYKATHVNHPSAVWVRESSAHYVWLFMVYKELCRLYNVDTGKIHKTALLIPYLRYAPSNIPSHQWLSDPHLAIDFTKYPNVKKFVGDAVKSYQEYLCLKFGEWSEKNRAPKWYNQVPAWYK